MRLFEKEIAATERWFDSLRIAGIVHLYASSGSRAGAAPSNSNACDSTVAPEAAEEDGSGSAGATDRLRAVYRPEVDGCLGRWRSPDLAEGANF